MALILVLCAFTLPAGVNYYFKQQVNNQVQISSNSSFEFPDMTNKAWSPPAFRPPTSAANGAAATDMSMNSVTAKLEAKLEQNPGDISGWILLGRSYVALGQPQRAITLFEERIVDNPDNIDLLLSYGETLTQFNQGNVSDKAKGLFEKANIINPLNPRTEYNLALYDMQNNQGQKAYDRLKNLLDNAPENAPWIAQVKQRMNDAAGNVKQSSMPTPTAQQVTEVNNMSEGDRSAFIKNMVDGLAQDLKENPNNLNGWLNLGRSYGVLGQWQKSADAYKQATELSPNDQKIKELYTSAIANLNQ